VKNRGIKPLVKQGFAKFQRRFASYYVPCQGYTHMIVNTWSNQIVVSKLPYVRPSDD